MNRSPHNLQTRKLMHQRVMQRYSQSTRFFIRCLCGLFKLCFSRRWRLAQDQMRRSSLGIAELEAKWLTQWSLEHLALTVIQAFKRALSSRGQATLKAHGETLEARLLSLEAQGVTVEGRGHLETVMDTPRGVIIVSAHIGAWEELISLGSWINRPVKIISKRMRNGVAQWLWDRSRRASPKRLDQGKRAREIVSLLRRGGVVADVLDQHDPRNSALALSFLGRTAYTSGDLARLAIASDALIIPLFLIRGSSDHSTDHQARFTLIVGTPIDHQMWDQSQRALKITEITQQCLDHIETVIIRAPEQWMWLHRRWKIRPKVKTRVL